MTLEASERHFISSGAVCGVLAAPASLLDAMPGNSEWVVDA